MSAAARPPGAPERLWIVIRPGGERHYLEREPLEGIGVWAKGLDATILEYSFGTVIHRPPPKGLPKPPPKPPRPATAAVRPTPLPPKKA